MWSLMYGISGMSIAMQVSRRFAPPKGLPQDRSHFRWFILFLQGATDRKKAGEAAIRIFELIDRDSQIDPLSEEGEKGV